MRLKRFLASSVSAALEQVKRELGPEAVIVSTEKKRIKEHGTKGFRTLTEVVAAIETDDGPGLAAGRKEGAGGVSTRGLSPDHGDGLRHEEDGLSGSRRHGQADFLRLLGNAKGTDGTEGPPGPSTYEEIKELRSAICQVSAAVTAIIGGGSLPGSEAGSEASGRDLPLNETGSPILEVNRFLTCLDLDASTQQLLAARIFAHFAARPITQHALISWMEGFISKGLRAGAKAETAEGPCWWAFIGPTGVGKTTTLAKIAARLRFMQRKTGVLVSVDSYRLGAAEQLRKYAQLMELPFETASTNRELLRIFARYRDLDFILVDTTGRNPFSQRHARELQRIFEAVPELMAQVMLCSSYDIRQIVKAINFYKRFPVAGYTLTKTDEIGSSAAPLLAVLSQNLPLSYITNGQRVPEDIMQVGPALVRRMVMEPVRRRLGLEPEHRDKSATA
jgi:flagellar biosynthesis protein FlhF